MPDPSAARARDAGAHSIAPAWFGALAAILLASACLRPAITAFGPLAPRIADETGLGAGALGLLGALPIACFSLVSFVVHAPSRRFGAERVLFVALVVIAAGTALRLAPGLAPLWIGTVLVGAGAAVGNVLGPALMKREFPGRIALATGAYSTVLTGAAALGSGLAVPIAIAAGDDWRVALSASLPIAVAAVAVWAVLAARRRASSAADATVAHAAAAPPTRPRALGTRRTSMWGSPIAWWVSAYMGLQSFGFYVTVTWLPAIEQAAGVGETASGVHLMLNQLTGVMAGIALSIAMGRRADQRLAAVGTTVPMLAACVGLLVAPGPLAALWAMLLGGGQGCALIVALALMGLRTADAHDTSRLSGMAQGVGYGLAAVGPFAAGVLRQVTDSWTPVVLAIAASAVALAIAGLGAGRDVTIGHEGTAVADERSG